MTARVWTRQEVLALGVRTDLVTAYNLVFGGGKNRAWEAYHRDELPFPALRVGRKVVVPVAPLLRLLELDLDMRMDEAPTSSTATDESAALNNERNSDADRSTEPHSTHHTFGATSTHRRTTRSGLRTAG